MIKCYLEDIIKRFKQTKIATKLFIVFFILLEIFFLVASFSKTNYEVMTPGYLEEASQVVSVNTNNSKGHILTVSVVSFNEVSLIQYWLSKNETKFVTEVIDESVMTNDEYNTYAIISKKVAITTAIMVAYEKARLIDDSINLVYEYLGLIVYRANKSSDIVPNDIITEINGVKVDSTETFYQEYYRLLGSDSTGGEKQKGDSVTLTFLRYDSVSKKYNSLSRSVVIYEEDGKLRLGLSVYEYFELNGTNSMPSFTVNYNEKTDAKGSSGGAMMALSIYNALLAEDITQGLVIAGTGTIARNGDIGAIGGIEQKTIKAYMGGVDIFFVDNLDKDGDGFTDYEKAIMTCEKYGYDSTFIKAVTTFDEMISILKTIGENNE